MLIRMVCSFILLLTLGQTVSLASIVAKKESFSEVAPGVYSFLMFGVNSMVVEGENGVLVTDPAGTIRAKKMREVVETRLNKTITHVALTHEHYDHVAGLEIFHDTTIIAQENVPEVLAMSTLFSFPEVNEVFKNNYKLDLGNITVDMKHLGHGDGTGTVVMHVPQVNIVFSADMYTPKEFPPSAWKEDTNMLGMRAYLNYMVELNPAYAINSHIPGNSIESLIENAQMLNTIHDLVFPIFEKAISEDGLAAGFPLIFSVSEQIQIPVEYAQWVNSEKGFPSYVRRMALSLFHGG